MAFKKPQVTKVKTDIQSLSIYLRSVKKFGKTTLFRDTVLEKFGDPEKGLLIGIGAENGYSILDNLNATQAENWSDMDEIKEWLISEKGKEHDVCMVGFDVIDELIPMAEEEIIRLSKVETGKACKQFNAAFGGFGEPRKRIKKLLKDYFTDLMKAGISPFAISHTSVKSIKEKGDDTEGYQTLTSNLSNDYEGIFGDIFDCVLTGYIDRDIEGGKVTSATRKLFLRGNGFVDAGCRFAEGAVPEYIVFDKPNMAKDFIETLENGLKNSRTVKITDDEFEKEQKNEKKELQKKAEESKEIQKNKGYSEEEKQNKVNQIKENFGKLDMSKVQEILKAHSVSSFAEASVIPDKCLDEIISLIK